MCYSFLCCCIAKCTGVKICRTIFMLVLHLPIVLKDQGAVFTGLGISSRCQGPSTSGFSSSRPCCECDLLEVPPLGVPSCVRKQMKSMCT
jgi:hypothetical protein